MNWITIGSGNGLSPDGIMAPKPLPEPVLTKISDAICHFKATRIWNRAPHFITSDHVTLYITDVGKHVFSFRDINVMTVKYNLVFLFAVFIDDAISDNINFQPISFEE